MAAATDRPEFSRAELQAAFDRLRRPGWPLTLDEALRDRLRAALLRADVARHERRTTVAVPARRAGAYVDVKRLAGGDRDDD